MLRRITCGRMLTQLKTMEQKDKVCMRNKDYNMDYIDILGSYMKPKLAQKRKPSFTKVDSEKEDTSKQVASDEEEGLINQPKKKAKGKKKKSKNGKIEEVASDQEAEPFEADDEERKIME